MHAAWHNTPVGNSGDTGSPESQRNRTKFSYTAIGLLPVPLIIHQNSRTGKSLRSSETLVV